MNTATDAVKSKKSTTTIVAIPPLDKLCLLFVGEEPPLLVPMPDEPVELGLLAAIPEDEPELAPVLFVFASEIPPEFAIGGTPLSEEGAEDGFWPPLFWAVEPEGDEEPLDWLLAKTEPPAALEVEVLGCTTPLGVPFCVVGVGAVVVEGFPLPPPSLPLPDEEPPPLFPLPDGEPPLLLPLPDDEPPSLLPLPVEELPLPLPLPDEDPPLLLPLPDEDPPLLLPLPDEDPPLFPLPDEEPLLLPSLLPPVELGGDGLCAGAAGGGDKELPPVRMGSTRGRLLVIDCTGAGRMSKSCRA